MTLFGIIYSTLIYNKISTENKGVIFQLPENVYLFYLFQYKTLEKNSEMSKIKDSNSVYKA